ncbi:hypothetical protein FGG08_000780 [Glutinoglossum americanum]|uniref:Uncharacterized protein n=1 Tax=Glutinoglossum americanum TaxID=1670608 RepID=A0A9P8IHS5_9PEZI|nr:hypothetical protein FGG08_000780 [Glutinoglossum americanum]
MDSSSDKSGQFNSSSMFGTGSFQTPSPQSTSHSSHPSNSSVSSSATSSGTFTSTYSQQMAVPESTPQAKQLDQPFPPNTQSSHGQKSSGQPRSQGQSSQERPAAPGYSPNNGGPTATSPFLKDFSLVAEAAKRAQVSILVRDLDGVTL